MSLAPPSMLAISCVTVALSLAPQPAAAQASVAPSEAGPRYRADGKDADAYGKSEGYPACTGMAYVREDRCRVWALSHFDTVFPAKVIAAPKTPSVLARAARVPGSALPRRTLDVGGPDLLSYGEMLARIAELMLVGRPALRLGGLGDALGGAPERPAVRRARRRTAASR